MRLILQGLEGRVKGVYAGSKREKSLWLAGSFGVNVMLV